MLSKEKEQELKNAIIKSSEKSVEDAKDFPNKAIQEREVNLSRNLKKIFNQK